MDFKAQLNWLFLESWSLLTAPKDFWKIKLAKGFSKPVVGSFFLPLTVLVGLAVFLGELLWKSEPLLSYALLKGLREAVSYLLQYFVAAAVLFRLLQNHKGTGNKKCLDSVLAYSLLPFLAASTIIGLFPGLYVLGIAGLYGFYLFITGAQTCLEIPKNEQARFILLALLLIVLIFGTINWISWKIFQAFFPYGA
ncbi:YIP1 family protein [Mangrovibacterium marinum]|uniref:Yip1 domain-containing protein n=1 Tax=Mangrovibacterium marinum TaxID=1639118 RepID=A0A2T5C5B8_9BACT|nr:YIP1 family protein [Mangrovibacterium marinum]PTN10083.1 hypothetical protein C8N47_10266 [Mangrovibacterium marinum]